MSERLEKDKLDNMKKILIATLGTRDLQFTFNTKEEENTCLEKGELNGISIFKDRSGYVLLRSPRKGGEQILQRLKEFRSSIRFPIIEPVLNEYTFDEIVLVATNQSETVEPRFYNNDTVYLADIIEEMLTPKGYNVDVFQVNNTVAHLENQHRYFAKNLLKGEELIDPAHPAHIYLLTQSGVDQINFALLLSALESFPYLTLLTKLENETVEESQFPAQYKFYLQKRAISNLVTNYDYTAALSVVKEVASETTQQLEQLIEIAALKMNLELDDSAALAKQLADTYPSLKLYSKRDDSGLSQLFRESDFNIDKQQMFTIVQMLDLLTLYHNRKAYTPFVVLFQSMVESLCNLCIKSHEELPKEVLDYYHNKDHTSWRELQEIGRTLKRKKYIYDTVDASLVQKLKAVAAISQETPLEKFFLNLLDTQIPKKPFIEPLSILRNKSFLAHEKKAVTANKINKAVPNFVGTQTSGYFKFLKKLGIENTFGFNQLNQLILHELEQIHR